MSSPSPSREQLVPGSHLAIEVLDQLLPHTPRSELVRAVEQASRERSGMSELVAGALEALGARVLEVRAAPDELLSLPHGTPAFEVDSPHRLLLGKRGKKLRVFDERGRRTLSELEGESARQRRFWVVARDLALESIKAQSPVLRLAYYLKTERELVQLVLIYAAAVELLSLAAPLTVQVLINTIGFGMLIQPVFVLASVLLLSLGGAALLRIMQSVTIENLVRRFVQRTILDLGERVPRLPSAGAPRHPSHRFFEIASVDKAFFVLGLDLVALGLQIATATILLAVYHPILLGFAFAMALSAVVALHLPFRRAVEASIAESSAKYALGEWLAEGRVKNELTESRLMARWFETRSRSFRINVGQQIALFTIQVVFSALLLLLGGRLVIEGQLTLGQLVAAELVTTAALISLGKLGKQLPKVYDLLTSFEKLGRLIDLPLERPSGRADAAGGAS